MRTQKLREGKATPSFPLKGLDVKEERSLFKWGWLSDPLVCPPNEKCSFELMVGTTSPLGVNPSGGEGRKSDHVPPINGSSNL
nr:hypothetical protein [Sulfodiicoccus acidiphilus]